MKLLIDAELYLFTYASACEYEYQWGPDDWTYLCRHGEVKLMLQSTINELRDLFPGAEPVFCFGDRASFRYGIWPAYKENRRKRRKPAGFSDLCAWVEAVAPLRGWRAVRLPDVEGDDVIGILASPGDVICSWDKDMLTIPGTHYRNGEIIEVSQVEADRAFFTQVLVGDASDNYPGCPGAGEKTAEKVLHGVESELGMWEAVLIAYGKKGLGESEALQQARCARILRNGEYDADRRVPRLWVPPHLR